MVKTSREVMDLESLRKKTSKLYQYFKMCYRSAYSWTFGVSNESDHPIVFKLDLSESENLQYSTKGAHNKKLLQPREMWFMMHS